MIEIGFKTSKRYFDIHKESMFTVDRQPQTDYSPDSITLISQMPILQSNRLLNPSAQFIATVIGERTTVNPEPLNYNGLFITDFDGTLLRSDRTLDNRDLETLERLGRENIVRVIATGRSLYSLNRAIDSSMPIDYVIFSTGAGVIKYPEGEILRKIHLEPETVCNTIKILMEEKLNFMVHRPIPDNHQFAYWNFKPDETDFFRRIELYKECAWPLDGEYKNFGEAAQLLSIVPQHRVTDLLKELRSKLPQLTIIRTTSPLDGKSAWIELFHPEVSKSRAAGWLAAHLGIHRENTLSVGNDYNDLDLLEWADRRFVVGNAPEDLRSKFPAVSTNNQCGVTEAVNLWLNE